MRYIKLLSVPLIATLFLTGCNEVITTSESEKEKPSITSDGEFNNPLLVDSTESDRNEYGELIVSKIPSSKIEKTGMTEMRVIRENKDGVKSVNGMVYKENGEVSIVFDTEYFTKLGLNTIEQIDADISDGYPVAYRTYTGTDIEGNLLIKMKESDYQLVVDSVIIPQNKKLKEFASKHPNIVKEISITENGQTLIVVYTKDYYSAEKREELTKFADDFSDVISTLGYSIQSILGTLYKGNFAVEVYTEEKTLDNLITYQPLGVEFVTK